LTIRIRPDGPSLSALQDKRNLHNGCRRFRKPETGFSRGTTLDRDIEPEEHPAELF
jgi:hypothetical protein